MSSITTSWALKVQRAPASLLHDVFIIVLILNGTSKGLSWQLSMKPYLYASVDIQQAGTQEPFVLNTLRSVKPKQTWVSEWHVVFQQFRGYFEGLYCNNFDVFYQLGMVAVYATCMSEI